MTSYTATITFKDGQRVMSEHHTELTVDTKLAEVVKTLTDENGATFQRIVIESEE